MRNNCSQPRNRHSCHSHAKEAKLTPIESVKKALSLAIERRNVAPSFEIFSSIVAQLEYVSMVLSGEEKDRSRIKKIIVGHYAVREFEESDPEFADALMQVQAIVSKMLKGLKLDI